MGNYRKSIGFFLIFFPVIILLYVSLWVAVAFRYGGHLDMALWNNHAKVFSAIFAFWLVVFFIHGLFEMEVFRRYSSLFLNLVSAMVVNLLVAIVYFYFQPNLILTPRRFLLIQISIAFVLVLVWLLFVKYLVKNQMTQGVYLFSFNNELKELENEIHNLGYLGFKVLGHLNEQNLSNLTLDGKNIGVILPDNILANPQVLARFYELRKSGVIFYNHKNFYEDLLRRVYLSQINEVWFIENVNYQEKRFYNIIKRIIDFLAGLLSGVMFIITFPLCALLIKLSSKGPIFFVQERVGKNGMVFKVYKYRTMAGGPGNTWTSVNDPRITSIGRILRKSRLDELPQCINLLEGNMSLVGPRPEQVNIVEELRKQIPFYDERHLVKPGLTGWAQLNNVYAGNLEETKRKLQYDLFYIKHRSLSFDLEIILKTLYYIFTWQGR